MSAINANGAKDSSANGSQLCVTEAWGTVVLHTAGTVVFLKHQSAFCGWRQGGVNRRPGDVVLYKLSSTSLRGALTALVGMCSGDPSLTAAGYRLGSRELSTPRADCYNEIQRSENQN